MKTKFSLLLFISLFFISCSDSDSEDTTEVNIRLTNNSEVAFEDATFNGVNFGDIASGNTTEYTFFESSYSYGAVSIIIDGQEYGWVPIDFVGESLLEEGDYTFVYNFDTLNQLLSSELIRDN